MGKEQETDEQQTEQQANVSFSAGFARVRGESAPPSSDATSIDDAEAQQAKKDAPPDERDNSSQSKPDEQPGEKPDEKDDNKEDEPDEWAGVPASVRVRIENKEKALESRLHRVESRVGRINSTLDKQIAAANVAADQKGAASPSQAEIDAALEDDKDWQELKEEYPQWANGLEKFVDKRLSDKIPTDYLRKDDLNSELEARLDERELNRAHPDFQEQVNTAGFQDWFFKDGPTREEWQQFSQASSADTADQMISNWIAAHPTWWNERGSKFLSDHVSDEIALLDEYKQADKAQAAQAADPSPPDDRQERNNRRLRAAAPPKTSGQPAQQSGVSDEQAFSRGFNRVRKSSHPSTRF